MAIKKKKKRKKKSKKNTEEKVNQRDGSAGRKPEERDKN